MVLLNYPTEDNSIFSFFVLNDSDTNSCFTLHLCSIVRECWKYSISELIIVIKIAHYDAVVQQGTNDIFVFFKKNKCLGKIIGLVFICIYWAIKWRYTQMWCCSGKHDNHLISIFSAASSVLSQLFFFFWTLWTPRSYSVKRKNYCL